MDNEAAVTVHRLGIPRLCYAGAFAPEGTLVIPRVLFESFALVLVIFAKCRRKLCPG